jgi:trk system potassium uptake protein TrkH
MIDLRPVLWVIGVLLSLLALAMGLLAVVDLAWLGHETAVFAAAAGFTLFIGASLILANHHRRPQALSLRQTFLVAAVGWLVIAGASALPFAFAGLNLSPVDAVFEAVGGVTATSSTILRRLDTVPAGLLLWRGLLQWIGGLGALALGLLVLPELKVGGMQLFRLENAGRNEGVTTRATRLALGVLAIYVGVTAALAGLLWAAGMNRFDAVVHALSTISCGGFSTQDASIGHWHNAAIDWVILFGMVLGGAPFVVYLQLATRRWRSVVANSQLRWYLTLLVATSLVIAIWLILTADLKPLPALRHAAFAVASVMTGTGFATVDWGNWGGLPAAVLLLLTFIGGCAGSTAGGIKIFRLQVLIASARVQMIQLLHPSSVLLPRYEGRPVPEAVSDSVLGYLFVFLFSFAVLAMGLSLTGLDFASAISASASALANLGPGLTPSVGPTEGYAHLPDAAKWMLAAGMLFGRLELFLVLALFSRGFWRD